MNTKNIIEDSVKGVYIAVLNCGEARVELMKVLLDLTRQGKYKIMIDFPHDKPISNNRNKIVKDFLKREEYDYLIMIDDDIVPPVNFLNMVDYNVDIMTPIMFANRGVGVVPLALEENDKGGYNVIGEQSGEDLADEGLLEVDATGTGCMIMSRKVLEDDALKAPFLDVFDEDGIRTMGLDLNFCRRAKKVGYKVYVHTDYVASHMTDGDLKDTYTELMDKSKRGLSLQEVGSRSL